MNPTETPNAEALEPKIKIGPFECRPFSLKTLINLERINSPFVVPPRDEKGEIIKNYSPTMEEIGAALWVFLNSHRPDTYHTIADKERFYAAVDAVCSQIYDFAEIAKGLSAIFAGINKTLQDAGLAGENGEKKGMIGSLR